MSDVLPFALAASMHFLVLVKVDCGELEWSQLKNGQFGDVGNFFITWLLQCLGHWKQKGSRGGEFLTGAVRRQDSIFDEGIGLEPASECLWNESLRSIQTGLKCIVEHHKKCVGVE